MRIITGTAKGHNLKVPKNIRPTQEIVRAAVFSILGDLVIDATCLDLFAGSGAYGIEALSRGAKWCDFVDIERNACNTIEESLQKTNFSDRADVIRWHALRFLANTRDKYDLIFVDPPYDLAETAHLLKLLKVALKDKGIVLFERAKENPLTNVPAELLLIDQRTFGSSQISFLKAAS